MQLTVRCDCGTVVEVVRQVLHGEEFAVLCPGCECPLVVGQKEWAGLEPLPPQPPASFRGLISAHPAPPAAP